MSADETDGRVVIVSGEVQDGYETVELDMVAHCSYGMSWHNDGRFFRHNVLYLKDGRVDGRRSRFYIDGKRISMKAYRAEGGFW